MGNTATKESRQSAPSIGATVLLSPASKARGERRNSQPHDRRGSHSGQSHTGSRESTGHRRSRRSENSAYKMIVDPNETVDGGYLFPQGVYQGSQDFKVSVVREMIIKRRLAPFYKGLDSVNPNWTDEELLDAVNSTPAPEADDTAASTPENTASAVSAAPPGPTTPTGSLESPRHAPRHTNPHAPGPPTKTQQIWLYHNVHECPICFLMYPRLNTTRCCGQDICTECFVQIKRNAPHPPYTSIENSEATDVLDLISEPSCCPYCAQSDLGVIFEAPPFEWGIPSIPGSPGAHSPSQSSPARASPSRSSASQPPVGPHERSSAPRPRRTSVPASHPSVVTVDMIRPDWEEKLASARRRLARKSAAARALHRSALISSEGQASPDSSPRQASPQRDSHPHSGLRRHRRDSSLADIVEASRSMSAAQTRALERKMIEEAIQASLQ